MKVDFKYYLLFWVLISVIYCLFSVDGAKFWDSFFFTKDYVLPVIVLWELQGYKVRKQDKAFCIMGIFIYLVKFITDVGYIVGLVDITKQIDTVIHVLFILIILAIFGYDRKT